MPLSAGDKIGPYEILSPLGKGGMGEVYRARDPKLKRDVALKVLPEAFARDPERMARFQREAEVLASLNHPNIAAIYGVAESERARALVMELVEGESPKGPLPFDEAWHIASQIATALEYAHDKGVMHRDLKPANVKVTPEGVVKLLDFGLAKAFTTQREAPATVGENSPTLTIGATEAGVILGTAAYMSPEQARGKQVDKRADIWSFGVVLYELLTGERLFTGEDSAEILAAVIHKQPDFARAPAQVQPLLRECLEKDPKQRLRDIGDAKRLLSAPSSQNRDREGAEPLAAPPPKPRRLPWAIAALFAVAALALGVVSFRHVTEPPPQVLKVSILPPEKTTFSATSPPAISPDGRRLAFVASKDGQDVLWVRDMDSLTARALPGTEDASYPFWSPDSRWLAFFADGKLKKLDVTGGPAVSLASVVNRNARGGSWSKDDVILFAPSTSSSLFRVPAAGGNVTPATTLDQGSGEVSHRFPWFLPDGRHFLFAIRSGGPSENSGIYVGDIDSPAARRRLLAGGLNAMFTPPGYLLFVRDGILMAQPFDAAGLKTTGDAGPVAEQVDVNTRGVHGQFSVSRTGVLVYTSGSVVGGNQLTWFDRSGKPVGTVGPPGVVYWPAISPDGNTVAFYLADPQTGSADVWLHNLARGTTSRFTFGPESNVFPAWSPDGSHIAFRSVHGGRSFLHRKAADGSDGEEPLDRSAPALQRPTSWSRDGRYMILDRAGDPKTGNDIWVLPLFGDRKPFPYLQTPFDEQYSKLSPDGQWLAYSSNESKRFEVYVQKFTGGPAGGGKWQVSTNGGDMPVWSRDGKELFFLSPDRRMMAAPVKTGATFEAGAPKELFQTRIGNNPGTESYDVGKDGRFLIATPLEQSTGAAVTVVVNWQAALKK